MNNVQQTANEEVKATAKKAGILEGHDTAEQIVKKIYKAENPDKNAEKKDNNNAEAVQDSNKEAPSTSGAVAPAQSSKQEINTLIDAKSDFFIEIEGILSSDLKDIYNGLEPDIQAEFKNKGEMLACKIEEVMQSGTAKLKTIMKWIKEWLKIIPGINKFFLEQEAKIKTDKILSMNS